MTTKLYQRFASPNGTGRASNVSSQMIYPETAREILESCPWDKQRPTRQRQVKYYATLMQRGEWVDGSPVRLAWIEDQSRMVILDAKHRLTAQTIANAPVRYTLSVDHFPNEEAAAQAYATIDQGMKRTPFDQFHALGVDDEYGWTQTQTNKALACVKMIAGDFFEAPNNMPTSIQLQLLDKYGDVISDWYANFQHIVQPALRSVPVRRDVMSVGVATCMYSASEFGEDKIEEFWVGVLSGELLAKKDPRLVAHSYLLTTALQGSTGRKSATATAAYSMRYLANCFNAWVAGRNLSMTRVYYPDRPISIDGTPWDGKASQVERIWWDNA